MSCKAYADMPGGWRWLTGDASWEDYGGSWFKRVKGTRYYVVLRFENGKEHDEKLPTFMCDVLGVDLDALPIGSLYASLSCCGMSWYDELTLVSYSGDEIWAVPESPERLDHILVECCVAYGAYAPLGEAAASDHYPLRVRAEARRLGNSIVRDESERERLMKRPVNRIGSTADEYMRGDLSSALHRGPIDATKNIMRMLEGLPPLAEEGDRGRWTKK